MNFEIHKVGVLANEMLFRHRTLTNNPVVEICPITSIYYPQIPSADFNNGSYLIDTDRAGNAVPILNLLSTFSSYEGNMSASTTSLALRNNNSETPINQAHINIGPVSSLLSKISISVIQTNKSKILNFEEFYYRYLKSVVHGLMTYLFRSVSVTSTEALLDKIYVNSSRVSEITEATIPGRSKLYYKKVRLVANFVGHRAIVFETDIQNVFYSILHYVLLYNPAFSKRSVGAILKSFIVDGIPFWLSLHKVCLSNIRSSCGNGMGAAAEKVEDEYKNSLCEFFSNHILSDYATDNKVSLSDFASDVVSNEHILKGMAMNLIDYYIPLNMSGIDYSLVANTYGKYIPRLRDNKYSSVGFTDGRSAISKIYLNKRILVEPSAFGNGCLVYNNINNNPTISSMLHQRSSLPNISHIETIDLMTRLFSVIYTLRTSIVSRYAVSIINLVRQSNDNT